MAAQHAPINAESSLVSRLLFGLRRYTLPAAARPCRRPSEGKISDQYRQYLA